MEMHQVKSSNVVAVGHDGNVLHVTFSHGGTYAYHGVTAEQFNRLKNAKSVGSTLAAMNIKGRKL